MAGDEQAAKANGEFEKQYDRQIRLWGLAAQQRMANAAVLVIGVRGLAAEICKNLVLAGIGKVALMDDEIVQEEDLGAQYFVLEEHIGKLSRAEASKPQLQELNPLAKVYVESGSVDSLTEERIKAFNVVCVTGASLSAQVRLDEMCRKNGTSFFAADSHGLFASFFMDLNEHQYTVETKQKADSATQQSTSQSGSMSYPSLTEALAVDWTPFKRISASFYALQALYAAHDKHGRFLSDGDDAALAEIKTELASKHSVKESVFNDELVKLIGSQAKLDLSAVCSIVAGMVADQVIKCVSGKEKPLCNYFVFDGREGAGTVISLGGPK